MPCAKDLGWCRVVNGVKGQLGDCVPRVYGRSKGDGLHTPPGDMVMHAPRLWLT